MHTHTLNFIENYALQPTFSSRQRLHPTPTTRERLCAAEEGEAPPNPNPPKRLTNQIQRDVFTWWQVIYFPRQT